MKFTYPSGSQPLDGYTIKRGIGIGGFGEVYFAISDAGKEVALKRIQRNLDVELRGVKQCLNLKHHNLIALWDIRQDERGQGWVVMEYVSGESLHDVVNRYPNGMLIGDVQHWFKGIADGVAYLHDHGIVHRDLKPGNIFEDESVVKIGDYGLSKFISMSRRSGQTESVGTFHYMAPEIGKGVYGKEIDIYALGIILYEMLTGRVPFDGESSQEIIMKHLTSDPDVSEVPEQYRSVIEKALAKDPDLRYGNVRQMLSDVPLGETGNTALTAESTSTESPAAAVSGNQPLVIKDENPDMLIITDDDKQDEIILGDVQEIVTAEPVEPPKRPPTQPPQNRRVPVRHPAALGASEQTAAQTSPRRNAAHDSANRTGLGVSTWLKIVLLGLAAIMIVLNAYWLIPVCVLIGVPCLIVYGVRSLIQRKSGNRQRPTDVQLRAALATRAPSERVSDLTGAMLKSLGLAALLGIAVMLVGVASYNLGSSTLWAFGMWAAVTIAGCTSVVMATGKFWEGKPGRQYVRRLTMLAVGLAVGALAFTLYQTLLVQESDGEARLLAASAVPMYWGGENLPEFMRTETGGLALPAYLVFFAGLLAIVRWWKQSDPLRKTRLSIWAVVVCVLWAMIFPFAQPYGILLAAAVSICVQLSSPWMSPKERTKIREQLQEA